MRIYPLLLALSLGLSLGSCDEEKNAPPVAADSNRVDTQPATAAEPAMGPAEKVYETKDKTGTLIEVKTYALLDPQQNTVGWGYDLWFNGKRTIHQPIIPGAAGVNYFRSKADAEKTGRFAADKMVRTGTWPTIIATELDSLGIKR